MSDRVAITLLCEDSRHEQFIREFLKEKKRTARRVFPDGYRRREKGGVKPNNGFVLDRATVEVKEARKHPPKRALILVVDGDERGFESRVGKIIELLKNDGAKPLDKSERIAVIIPCCNIETWLHHFAGNEANETDDFKDLYRQHDATPQAIAFAAWVSDGNATEVEHLPALNEARIELRRLHELMKNAA